MKIEFDTIDELKELISFLGCLSDKELSKEDIQKLKKSERNRKDYQNRKLKNAESADSDNEEERVEEGFPPSVPSSPSSPNTPIIPITPIIPSSQEDEKEEGKNKKGGRGELKAFGQFVRLTDEEYNRLVQDFGFDKVERMIQRMNDYIGEDETGKLARKYQTRNHNLTLRNWENRKAEENRQPKAKVTLPKTQKSFHDMAVERGLVEETPTDDVIESFWRD